MHVLTVGRRSIDSVDDTGRDVRFDIAVPFVDGHPLHRIVGAEPTGRSLGVPPVAAPRWWMGELDATEGASILLDGGCGCAPCCGIDATITVGDDVVTWTAIRGRGRPPVPPGPASTFDRPAYEAAIDGIEPSR